MLNKNWIQFIFILMVIVIIVYTIFIILGYKEFIIWSQVEDYLFNCSSEERFNNVLELFEEKHPHAMRVALIFPIFQVADNFNIKVVTLYSLVILFLLISIYRLIISILRNYTIIHYTSLILIFLLFLSIFMNGRIVFALFGNTLILYILFMKTYSPTKMYNIKFLFYIIVALWFCSVSSGTFMVAVGTLILFYFLNILIELPYISKKNIFLFTLLIILILILFPTIIQLVNKNLDYFDGSFIHMLNHGIGKYITKSLYIFGILLFIFPFLFIRFIYFLKSHSEFILPVSMIITSSSIGIFGLSSLVSGLSAYLLFIYMYLNKNRLKVIKHV